ncbi:MAG: hypothetical protein LBL21_04985 [Rickettsiales bacterium]|jgi:hypothetical protein|nr:hypothetical protein [Rickettsiales bacterium]
MIEPKVVQTTIDSVIYKYGMKCHYCFRKDNGRILEFGKLGPHPKVGEEIMLWFEQCDTDFIVPCVAAWGEYMVNLKNRRRKATRLNFLKSDNYNFDAATRRHYEKYKKEFLRARKKESDIAKLEHQKDVVESIKISNDLTSYQAAKNDVVNYLNRRIFELQQ